MTLLPLILAAMMVGIQGCGGKCPDFERLSEESKEYCFRPECDKYVDYKTGGCTRPERHNGLHHAHRDGKCLGINP